MVMFDDEQFKLGFFERIKRKFKNLFHKQEKEWEMINIEKVEPGCELSWKKVKREEAETDTSRVIVQKHNVDTKHDLADCVAKFMADNNCDSVQICIDPDFLMKKYHLIGTHNAMISAMNDDINTFKHIIADCQAFQSQYKVIDKFLDNLKVTPNADIAEQKQQFNSAKKAMELIIQANRDMEKSYQNQIKKLTSKILNRSVLIGDLTRAETMDEIREAEKAYKMRSKQKPNKEKKHE